MNTHVHEKVLSLSYHAIVIIEQFFSSKAHFLANVFHEITGITEALKENAHDQNEQIIEIHIPSTNITDAPLISIATF